jgi:hypothetical protein
MAVCGIYRIPWNSIYWGVDCVADIFVIPMGIGRKSFNGFRGVFIIINSNYIMSFMHK